MQHEDIPLGLCECGCGQETPYGKIVARPWRFMPGHQKRFRWQRASESYEVDAVTGCWNWTNSKTAAGYGGMTAEDGRRSYAHREFYKHFVGPIPEGLEIDHLCSNRGCVNPAHLEPVTTRENTRRAHERKRERLRAEGSRVGSVHLRRDCGTWRARICIDGRERLLGTHKSEEAAWQAIDAYLAAHDAATASSSPARPLVVSSHGCNC